MWGSMMFMAAIRAPSVGRDTAYFCRRFLRITAGGETRFEPGFVLLSRFLGVISSDPQILIIATSIIIFGLFARFIYINSQDVILSTFLFISMRFFFLYMNIMRQAIAIVIILLGFEYLKKNKNLRYCLAVFLASAFHYSALVALPLILFKRIRYKKSFYAIAVIIAIVIYLNSAILFTFFVNFDERFSHYVGEAFERTTLIASQMYVFIYFLIITFASTVMYRVQILTERASKYINNTRPTVRLLGLMQEEEFRKKSDFYIVCMFACLYTAIIAVHALIFHRIVEYFTIWLIVLIPQTIMCIKDTTTKKVMYAVIIFVGIAHFYITLFFRPWWDGILPYTTFFGIF